MVRTFDECALSAFGHNDCLGLPTVAYEHVNAVGVDSGRCGIDTQHERHGKFRIYEQRILECPVALPLTRIEVACIKDSLALAGIIERNSVDVWDLDV